MWPALVMPALAVVLALSLARNAWVGACFAVALLLMMRDFRLTAVLPVVAAVFFATAPAPDPAALLLDLRSATISAVSDRFAMAQGRHPDHPRASGVRASGRT